MTGERPADEPAAGESAGRDRAVLVTGATSGIGREIALLLAARGYDIAPVGRDQARLEAVERAVTDLGTNAHPICCDLTEAGAAAGVAEQVRSRCSSIDSLVLAAGVYLPAPLSLTDDEMMERQWRINVFAPLALARECVDLVRPGGSIVFISSISGHVGFANEAAYAATKGAVDAIVRALSIELAAQGIRVNGVAPGFTETPMNEAVREDAGVVSHAVAATPAGRLGRPRDMASAVAYLISEEASYLTGVILPVDGGYPTSAIQAGLV